MLQKKRVKNRYAALFVASKNEYSIFLKLTMSDIAQCRKNSVCLQGGRHQQ